jgi:hypothetical protein
VSPAPFPAPGPDGDEPPLPGDTARNDASPDGATRDVARDAAAPTDDRGDADAASPADAGTAVLVPPPDGVDDYDADADLARWLDDIDSGREPIPAEEDLQAPPVMFTLGQAADVDPAVLAAMAGPDGLGGQAFTQDQPADAMPPGPLLAALTENAAHDVTALSDDALLGMMSAAKRLAARAEYLELTATAEFTARRQAQLAASAARKDPRGQRAGEFADAELGMHLLISGRKAGDRMDQATALTTRLPCTYAGLGAGTVTPDNAYTIWFYTRFLSDADAAEADAVLADAASRIRQDSLAAKAAALEIKLDPEAARARKEHARRESRRVEARRELSGNMSFGARELAVEDALAVNAAVEAAAAALRRAGLDGSLRDLRVTCFLDRLLGRNPLDRLPAPAPGDPAHRDPDPSDPAPGDPASGDPAAGDLGTGGLASGGPGTGGRASGGPGTGGRASGGPGVGDPDGDPAPFPALVNLLVPADTAFGWSTTPGQAGRWGLLDPWDTRRLLQAASQHPRTRWCVTAVGPDGTAVAHGCSRGPHPWTPAPPPTTATGSNTRPGTAGPGTTGPGTTGPGTTRPPPGPDKHQQAQLAELLRALNITMEPIARGTCDHRHYEERYTPSRKLGHLIRARTATCPAPGCGASAYHADLDHTVAWPQGTTDECNIAPPCRHHHRVKQAPGWRLEQTSPGVMRWTAPSGRIYVTTPTVYDV